VTFSACLLNRAWRHFAHQFRTKPEFCQSAPLRPNRYRDSLGFDPMNVQELGQTNAVRTQDLLIGDALGPVLPPNVDEEFVAAESELC
jgi:hypothetical protein